MGYRSILKAGIFFTLFFFYLQHVFAMMDEEDDQKITIISSPGINEESPLFIQEDDYQGSSARELCGGSIDSSWPKLHEREGCVDA